MTKKTSTTTLFGLRAVSNCLQQQPEQILELWVQQDGRFEATDTDVIKLAKQHSIAVQSVKKSKLDQLSENGVHQGIMAKIRVSNVWDENDLFAHAEDKPNQLWLMLEGLNDPHNLGACLRTAEAAGVAGVILPLRHSVPITPTVRKVACGAAENLALYQVTNLVRCLTHMHELGIASTGTVADPTCGLFYETAFTQAEVLVMGAEGTGLRHLTVKTCQRQLTIPMAGQLASLNVSVATGVCLFEMVRQRRTKV
jgi:23S rRNA (guanosine2251-2'-O)-methyltransferase